MLLLVVSLLVSSVTCFYSSGDKVETLTQANFDSKVLNDDSVWIVEFYAPWCGHCKSLTPEWKKAAVALSGVVKLGAVDADDSTNSALASKYGVTGFPTIKIFAGDKSKPTDYRGGRTHNAIVQEGLKHAQTVVQDRLAGKSGGSKSGGGGGGSKKGNQDDVIELTETSFQQKVLDSKDLWLVEFYAPWCGHCKKLAPEWASAATQLKGKVKLGAVDATQFQTLANKYGVRGYPTIKYFPAGPKMNAEDYNGGRTADDIVAFAEEKLEAFAEPPEIRELLNDAIFREECEQKSVCVISVLQDILDSGVAGRNKFIETLKTMGEIFKKNKFGWVWTSPGYHPELENALDVASYPALVALNLKKKAVSKMMGGFNEEDIKSFLLGVIAGRTSHPPAPLKVNIEELKTVEPWDGKEGEMPVEEEDYDLDDDEEDEPEEKTEL